jgi:uncharacterized protein YyaL (SSP411 family)
MPNRLAGEKSPYLLQHANNPVDWHPWGEEAFARARAEQKPIFLSIGYSTCHWCHVMERESFENEDIAKLLNASFVPVKVDREERPDVDGQYMTAVQGLTGAGGWPLTAFLTPEGKPFFAGTYFPPDDRWGRPGLRSVLLSLARAWERERTALLESADRVAAFVADQVPRRPGTLGHDTLDLAARHLRAEFDSAHGGFGRAPKFPRPHLLTFLLRRWARTGEADLLHMVEFTLDAMAAGGIHDHLGGGFARYSTDAEWLVPHFEKMLYDQALLARAYLEAYQITKAPRHAATARDIFTYVLRDLRDPAGAFHSAEDADSEGEEGRFYVWTADEVRTVVGEKAYPLVSAAYGITPEGNWEGRTVLARVLDDAALADRLGGDATSVARELAAAREALFRARAGRVRPLRDDKILTDWNGLMIAALAVGGRVLGDPDLLCAAREAASFLLTRLRPQGVLHHRHRDGETAIPAFLDDHAFLALGLFELHQATLEVEDLRAALAAARDLMRFEDADRGGFTFTAAGHEPLLTRDKPLHDGAVPSGNAVAAGVLLRLGSLSGDAALRRAGERTLEAFGGVIAAHPAAFPESLSALDLALGPSAEVVVAGRRSDAALSPFLKPFFEDYFPRVVHALHEPGTGLETLLPFVGEMALQDGRPAAYVCLDRRCGLPAGTAEEMLDRLRATLAGSAAPGERR